MIGAYPKIFALGTIYIKDIFDGDVEVSEKVDGSQFSFCKSDNTLYARSKRKQIDIEKPDQMFIRAIEYIKSIYEGIPNDLTFYCEYLNKPKHNVLAYNRAPKNNLVLFAIRKADNSFLDNLEYFANCMNIDSIPILFSGKTNSREIMDLDLLKNESYLGGQLIEGFVVKNYNKGFLFNDQVIPIMSGKFVSERFKEVHAKNWKTGDSFEVFKESFKTEARWNKAIQALREQGLIEGDPRDIGKLIKQVKSDIVEEEKENIKEFLWNKFNKEILNKSIHGLPEWYKIKIVRE